MKSNHGHTVKCLIYWCNSILISNIIFLMKCMHNIIVHTKTSTVQITLTDVLVSQHHVIKYISVKYFLLLYQAPDTGQGATCLLPWCRSKSPALSEISIKPVPVHSTARFPSHFKTSTPGVAFIHLSEFRRAGRRTKSTVTKKCWHILSELHDADEILLLLNSSSFASEFLLTWKQD